MDWVRGIVDDTVAGRRRLAEALRTRGFGVVEGEANFVLAATGPGSATTIKAGLADRGIGVRAFEGLDGVGDAIRVTVGPPAAMDRFVSALDEVLAAGVRLSPPEDLEVWP